MTVEEVRFPAIFLADPDVSRSAVCIVVAVFAVIPVAVLVTLGAHLTITTIDSFREVALDEVGLYNSSFFVFILSMKCSFVANPESVAIPLNLPQFFPFGHWIHKGPFWGA